MGRKGRARRQGNSWAGFTAEWSPFESHRV